MIREAAQNIIDHPKGLLIQYKNIVERYKRNIPEAQKSMAQEKYRNCVKCSYQTNLNERSYTIENRETQMKIISNGIQNSN